MKGASRIHVIADNAYWTPRAELKRRAAERCETCGKVPDWRCLYRACPHKTAA